MFSQETTTFVSAERQQHASTTHTTSTFVLRSHHPSLYKEPESDLCKRCMKFIYPLELMGPVMGNKYHKLCFRCHTCNRLLDFKTYRTNLNELQDKNVYCQTHNPKNGKYTETIFIYNNRARSKSPSGRVYDQHALEASLGGTSSRQHSYRQARSSDNLTSINDEYESVRPAAPLVVDHHEYDHDNEYHNSSAFSEKKAFFSSSSKSSSNTAAAASHHSNINISQSGGGATTLQKQISENSNSGSSGKLNEDKPLSKPSTTTSKSGSNFSLDDYYASHGYLNANRVVQQQNNAVIDVNDSSTTINRVQYVPAAVVDSRVPLSTLNRQSSTSKKSGGADFYDDNGAEEEELAKYDHVVGNHDETSADYQFNSTHGYFDHQDRYHHSTTRNQSVSSNQSGNGNGRDFSRSQSTDSSVCNNKTEIIIPVQTISLDGNNNKQTHSDRYESSSHRKDSSVISNNGSSVFINDSVGSNQANRTSSHAHLVNIVGEMIARDKELRVFNLPTTPPPIPSPRQDSIRFPVTTVSPPPSAATYSEPIVPTASSTGLNTTITTSSVHHHHESSSSTSVQNVVVEVVEASSGGVSNNSFASSVSKQQMKSHDAASNSFSSSNYPVNAASGSSLPPNNNSSQHVIIPAAPSAILPTPPPRFNGPNANIKQIFSEIINHPANVSDVTTVSPPYQKQSSNPGSGFTGPNSNLKNIMSDMITHDALFVDSSLPPRDHMVPIQIINTNNNNSNNNVKPTHEELVKRLGEIVGEDKGFGLAKLTSHYDELRSRLSITVHEARHLRNTEKKGVIDPYARVYLVPDDKPSYKRKTRLIKDNVNPVWQETFDYPMPMARALTKTLVVNLKDERGLFERQENVFLGEVVINLKDVQNLTSPHTKWYYLQPSKMTTK